MSWWLLVCVLLVWTCHNMTAAKSSSEELCSSSSESAQEKTKEKDGKVGSNRAKCEERAKELEQYVYDGNQKNTIQNLRSIQKVLAKDKVSTTSYIKLKRFVAVRYRAKSVFSGLRIHASDSEASTDRPVNNRKLFIEFPDSLNPGSENILFWTIVLNQTNWTVAGVQTCGDLYDNRLVGLSIGDKTTEGLQQPVKITMNLTTQINDTYQPQCVFLNYSLMAFDSNGCDTEWKTGWENITCSCDHLTYFGVLMITVNISSTDLTALTYISQIGSSLSLLCLVITVLLFLTNRKIRADISTRVHINLVIALILLNVHFLPSGSVAASHSTGLCFYFAVAIHYSLLATFCWTALEGFHLYLLLVRVFNIYIRRYVLKLCLIGWGFPAIIVSLVIILQRDAYGQVPLDVSNTTSICYISDNTVKMVSTVGIFSLVFAFNLIMFAITVRSVFSLLHKKEYGQSNCDRAKQNIAMLVGVTILLGITWGLIFFSFSELTTAGLYLFCILNSTQGVFIFMWFLMSLRKTSNSRPATSTETRST